MTNLQIKFFSVGCGDAISIRFLGNDNKYHNILIDGGVEQWSIYSNGIKKEILEIIERREQIDKWIISHIDDDHIGGILCLIKDITQDEDFAKQLDLEKIEFWFNYANQDYDTGIKKNDYKGVAQGIRLRDFLKTKSKTVLENITNGFEPIDFLGLKIKILSPDKSKFDKLVEEWKKQEIEIITRKLTKSIKSKANDYAIKIDDFDLSNFKEDRAIPNGSSIAFLMEYQEIKILFSADSHPSVIAQSIKKLGYSRDNKLKLNAFQVSHRGSKGNTSSALLELIDTNSFIISADTYNRHNLPNKEAMVRIIKNFPNQEIKFLITHKNDLTKSIFTIDKGIKNVKCEFPQNNSNAIILDF